MEKMTATISTQIRQAAMISWAVAVMNLGLEVNIFLTARILAILLVLVVRAEYISDMEVPGRILEKSQSNSRMFLWPGQAFMKRIRPEEDNVPDCVVLLLKNNSV